MNYLLRQEINNLSHKIRIIYDIKVPIISIKNFISDLGVSIKKNNQTNNFPNAKIEIAGGSFKKTICGNQAKVRKRFLIVHELEYVFLHTYYCIHNEIWNKNNEYFISKLEEIEYQIHKLIAPFLMSKEQLVKNIAKNSKKENFVYNITEVKEYFKVLVKTTINRSRLLEILL